MEAPLCEAFAVGDFSPWARQLFNEWQSEGLLSLSFEPNLSKFCHQANGSSETRIVLVENSPKSQVSVAQLRASNQSLLILWIGQTFQKEDLAWALEQRVYGILENPSFLSKHCQQLFSKVQLAQENTNRLNLLLQSLKGLILQTDTSSYDQHFISELKTGIKKVEHLSQQNELLHPDHSHSENPSPLPLAKSQTLGDVFLIMTDLERTGTLWIKGDQAGQDGKVEFIQGKIAFAETGTVKHLKAIYRMFCWKNPRFLFHRVEALEFKNPTIAIPLNDLIREGQAQASRFEKIKKEIPPSSLKLDFVPQSITASTALTSQDFHALVQLIELKYVSDVLEYSAHWDIELYESLINLRKSGYIRVAA